MPKIPRTSEGPRARNGFTLRPWEEPPLPMLDLQSCRDSKTMRKRIFSGLPRVGVFVLMVLSLDFTSNGYWARSAYHHGQAKEDDGGMRQRAVSRTKKGKEVPSPSTRFPSSLCQARTPPRVPPKPGPLQYCNPSGLQNGGLGSSPCYS